MQTPQVTETPFPLQALASSVHLLFLLCAAAWVTSMLGGLQLGILAPAAGVLTGLLLSIPFQRTIWLISAALTRMNQRKSLKPIPIRWHTALRGLVGQVNAAAVYIRQVSTLREDLLQRARENAAQQERNRLARDLHDSIKQQIFSISLSAASAQARWENDPDGASQSVTEIFNSSQEAMMEMKALLQHLSPAPLEKVGLVQALQDQCEALGYRTGAKVHFDIGELPDGSLMPADAQEMVFRIAQEAFNNVARHARADQVQLTMKKNEDSTALVLIIEDNGLGFDPQQVRPGMGLENIRQRVLALKGQINIHSFPGEGTTVRAVLPLEPPLFIETQEDAPRANTLNKIVLAGAAGGLALLGILFFPLYYFLHRQLFVSGADNRAVFLAVGMISVIALGTTGYFAAHWIEGSRSRQTLHGALAGALACGMAYFVLMVPAVAITGSSEMIQAWLARSGSGSEALRLLIETANGILWWQQAAFLGMLLIGAAFGAIGGFLCPEREATRPAFPSLAVQVVGSTLVLASAAAFLAAVMRFVLVEPTLQAAVSLNNAQIQTALPLCGLGDWLLGIPLLLYITILIINSLYLGSAIRHADQPVSLGNARFLTGLMLLVAIGVPAICLGLNIPRLQASTLIPAGLMDLARLDHPAPLRTLSSIEAAIVWGGLAVSLVLCAYHLYLLFTTHKRLRRAYPDFTHPVRMLAVIFILVCPGFIVWGTREAAVTRLVAGLVLLALCVCFIYFLFRTSRASYPRGMVLKQLKDVVSQAPQAGLAWIIVLFAPFLPVINADAALSHITYPLVVETLWRGSLPQVTLGELVNRLFITQVNSFVLTLLAASVLAGLLLLFISGLISLFGQFADSNGEAV